MHHVDLEITGPLDLQNVPIHSLDLAGDPFGYLSTQLQPISSNVRTHAHIGRLSRDNVDTYVVAKRFRSSVQHYWQNFEIMDRLFKLNTKVQGAEYILPYTGAALHIGVIILVNPLARNGNAVEYLAANPKADRHKLLIDVAHGLEFLHNSELVHGDLRPENVLIMDDGTAKISDFGLNEAFGKTPMDGEGPQELATLETIAYCPPEISAPRFACLWDSPAIDVYMFGILYTHLFEGNIPWIGLKIKEVLSAIVSKQMPPRPAHDSVAVQNGFTDDDWEICVACWSANPEDRPPITSVLQMVIPRINSDHSNNAPIGQNQHSDRTVDSQPEQQQPLSPLIQGTILAQDPPPTLQAVPPAIMNSTPDGTATRNERQRDTSNRFSLSGLAQRVVHMFR